MSMSIGGSLSINTHATQSAQGGQNARPAFANNQTWKSIGEMEKAWRSLNQEWVGYYSDAFAGSGAEGDGKITQEELSGLLQSEFGGMGVNFTDTAVDETNPKAGTFEVYIDGKTRQKMANDSGYRAKVMAVIQTEMAASKGYSVQTDAGVVRDRTTGLSMNMIEGGPLYEGVPHSAGGTSASGGVAMFSTSSSESGGGAKSILDQILEKLEEKRTEKKEAEKKEAAKKAREDLVEISAEARASLANRTVEQAAGTEKTPTAADAANKAGGGLDILV